MWWFLMDWRWTTWVCREVGNKPTKFDFKRNRGKERKKNFFDRKNQTIYNQGRKTETHRHRKRREKKKIYSNFISGSRDTGEEKATYSPTYSS